MESEAWIRKLQIREDAYSASRLLAVALTWTLCFFALFWPNAEVLNVYTLGGAVLMTVATAVRAAVSRIWGTSFADMLWWTVPVDFLSLGLLTVGLRDLGDPIYPLMFTVPVFYSYMAFRREAWIISSVGALGYLVARMIPHPPDDWLGSAAILLKSAFIAAIGAVATDMGVRSKKLQAEIEVAAAERENLTEQLRKRVAELQAVSQISDVMHSTLDLDEVGPLMLQILQRVITVPVCALLVVDKERFEALFSTSAETDSCSVRDVPHAFRFTGDPPLLHDCDSQLSHISVLEHKHMMVVLCVDAEGAQQLTSEDWAVLHAVSGELVIAVENAQLYKLTRTLAITDELTGLYNYRHLQQFLDDEVQRARRYGGVVSMIMIDADKFKEFNDTHGHIAGDKALADLGRVIAAELRDVDIAARYGGEEFAVVLPETSDAGALVVAKKIRQAISEHRFLDGEGNRIATLTASLGLAAFPTHAADKETLLRLADDALYRAKSSGRNRIRTPDSHPTGEGEPVMPG